MVKVGVRTLGKVGGCRPSPFRGTESRVVGTLHPTRPSGPSKVGPGERHHSHVNRTDGGSNSTRPDS